MPELDRNRKDHLLPQGYLDGFTGSNGRLQVYDIAEKRWFQSKTEDVACERGFYDYSKDVNPEQTADQAFEEYENVFPNLRRALVDSSFAGWQKHLPFLIRYFNQLRVRSRLFRQHVLQGFEERPPFKAKFIAKVPHPTEPGKDAYQYAVEPLEQTGEALKTAYNNISISKMRADLLEVPDHFYKFQWHLRLTNDPNRPVITADDAIRFEGQIEAQEIALTHFQTKMIFPLCWQACLIGRPKLQLPKTRDFGPSQLRELQDKYLAANCRFAYSPLKLDG
jgi:Protein of unknown function (DUF4238)